MKKLLGVSVVAMFVVSPMLANAAQVSAAMPAAPSAGNNSSLATAGYVKGAYTSVKSSVDNIVTDITVGAAPANTTYKAIVAGNSVAENLQALDAAVGNALTSASLEGYVTSSDLSSTLGGYVTSSALSTTLGDYVTSDALSTTLGNYVESSTLSGYVTSDALSTALSGYATGTDLSGYVTDAELSSTLGDYATKGQVLSTIGAATVEAVSDWSTGSTVTVAVSAPANIVNPL